MRVHHHTSLPPMPAQAIDPSAAIQDDAVQRNRFLEALAQAIAANPPQPLAHPVTISTDHHQLQHLQQLQHIQEQQQQQQPDLLVHSTKRPQPDLAQLALIDTTLDSPSAPTHKRARVLANLASSSSSAAPIPSIPRQATPARQSAKRSDAERLPPPHTLELSEAAQNALDRLGMPAALLNSAIASTSDLDRSMVVDALQAANSTAMQLIARKGVDALPDPAQSDLTALQRRIHPNPRIGRAKPRVLTDDEIQAQKHEIALCLELGISKYAAIKCRGHVTQWMTHANVQSWTVRQLTIVYAAFMSRFSIFVRDLQKRHAATFDTVKENPANRKCLVIILN
ncbi:hypothetical protein BC831DRAFT_78950 [Entophlyctis helioformis]|nr:hypothetical protein BC831DRAFT_78950 [Entophlyctis helioformis]